MYSTNFSGLRVSSPKKLVLYSQLETTLHWNERRVCTFKSRVDWLKVIWGRYTSSFACSRTVLRQFLWVNVSRDHCKVWTILSFPDEVIANVTTPTSPSNNVSMRPKRIDEEILYTEPLLRRLLDFEFYSQTPDYWAQFTLFGALLHRTQLKSLRGVNFSCNLRHEHDPVCLQVWSAIWLGTSWNVPKVRKSKSTQKNWISSMRLVCLL